MHLLPGFAKEEPDLSLDDVEGILNVAVVMPGNFLSSGDLEFIDAEARPFSMTSPSLDFIEIARVLDWFHGLLHSWLALPKLNCAHSPSIIGTTTTQRLSDTK